MTLEQTPGPCSFPTLDGDLLRGFDVPQITTGVFRPGFHPPGGGPRGHPARLRRSVLAPHSAVIPIAATNHSPIAIVSARSVTAITSPVKLTMA